MKLQFKLFSRRSRLVKDEYAGRSGLLAGLLRDEHGSIIVYMTLAVPVLIGIAALAVEGGFWLYKQRVLQSAADNAAYSAAAAYAADRTSDITLQARAITAYDYNLVNGQNNVTVAVNMPPSGGCHTGTSNYTGLNAVEVIVTQPQTPQLAGIWLHSDVAICGRGVAIVPGTGDCILALAPTGTAIGSNGKINNLNINLAACSIFSNSSSANSIAMTGNNDVITADAIGTVGNMALNGNSKSTIFNPSTGDPPVADPYKTAAASWSTSGGANQTNCQTGGSTCTTTLVPGTYANGITLGGSNNATYTMTPGIYYLGGNGFSIQTNHTTVTGTGGVTLVLTGSSSAITLGGQNSVFNIVAPTATGWNQGIAIWEPTSNGTNNFVGNSASVTITGVIYAPNADVQYTGNTGATATCTQIVSKTVEFGGNSINLTGNCSSVPGMKVFGQIAALVE
jgi:hypothetical protein